MDWTNWEKNRLFVEKSYLATPDHFLSAIFGISVKFHVDIGVQKMFEIFFRDEKKTQEMIFGFFCKISKFYKDSSQKLIFQILPFVKNPYRILRFFQKFSEISKISKKYFLIKFFHLEKNISNIF